MRFPGARRLVLAALAGALLGLPVEGSAQQGPSQFATGPITGIGYTPVIPDAFLAFGAFRTVGMGKWGVFADWKKTAGASLRDADNFRGDMSQVGPSDGLLRRNDEWHVVNAGIMRTVTGDMAILVGWGWASRVRVNEFVDLVNEGSYFVEDEEVSGGEGNPVVGLLFRGGRAVAFRFGLEGGPKRLSAGVYLMLR